MLCYSKSITAYSHASHRLCARLSRFARHLVFLCRGVKCYINFILCGATFSVSRAVLQADELQAAPKASIGCEALFYKSACHYAVALVVKNRELRRSDACCGCGQHGMHAAVLARRNFNGKFGATVADLNAEARHI